VQEQLNRLNNESSTTNASKENERPSEIQYFETETNKKLKAKLTASGSKAIRAQASRIVSSFKTQTIECKLAREYTGHSDGVWDIDVIVSPTNQSLLASASADHTACIWNIDTGKCLLKYKGHSGSVNSIKFHPTKDLILTSSGDHSAQIWQNLNLETTSRRGASSEEELDDTEENDDFVDERERSSDIRTVTKPLQEFLGHSDVVVSADFIASSNNELITASWDKTAILFNIETKAIISQLTGHDEELTHCAAHSQSRLVTTSSRDSTFRLWDFRKDINSVSVFQGHNQSVNSTIFAQDKIFSSSDDRTIKAWDLRNIRSPLFTIRTDSAVNRLAVSSNNLIAIPNDNRSIRIFEINSQRICRLQKRSHRRMVTSCCFKEDSGICKLFSSGFDRKIIEWDITI
jgi:WD40 repeat protein